MSVSYLTCLKNILGVISTSGMLLLLMEAVTSACCSACSALSVLPLSLIAVAVAEAVAEASGSSPAAPVPAPVPAPAAVGVTVPLLPLLWSAVVSITTLLLRVWLLRARYPLPSASKAYALCGVEKAKEVKGRPEERDTLMYTPMPPLPLPL